MTLRTWRRRLLDVYGFSRVEKRKLQDWFQIPQKKLEFFPQKNIQLDLLWKRELDYFNLWESSDLLIIPANYDYRQIFRLIRFSWDSQEVFFYFAESYQQDHGEWRGMVIRGTSFLEGRISSDMRIFSNWILLDPILKIFKETIPIRAGFDDSGDFLCFDFKGKIFSFTS